MLWRGLAREASEIENDERDGGSRGETENKENEWRRKRAPTLPCRLW